MDQVDTTVEVQQKKPPYIQIFSLLAGGIILLIILFWVFRNNQQVNIVPSVANPSPSQASLTPSQPTVTAEKLVFAPTKSLPSNLNTEPILINCPASDCVKGVTFANNQLSAKLPEDSPLIAAFDGTISELAVTHPASGSAEETYQLVILTKADQTMYANYYYKGSHITKQKQEVKQGETFAKVNGQTIKYLNNSSLVFELYVAEKTGWVVTKLTKENFK